MSEPTIDTQTLADSIAVHIKSMLELNIELTALEEQINQLQTQLNQAAVRKQELLKNRREAHKLLDYCLETNSDPMQSRLSNSDKELSNALNDSKKQKLMENQEGQMDRAKWYDLLHTLGVQT
jgi:chromosome segregation ATPase